MTNPATDPTSGAAPSPAGLPAHLQPPPAHLQLPPLPMPPGASLRREGTPIPGPAAPGRDWPFFCVLGGLLIAGVLVMGVLVMTASSGPTVAAGTPTPAHARSAAKSRETQPRKPSSQATPQSKRAGAGAKSSARAGALSPGKSSRAASGARAGGASGAPDFSVVPVQPGEPGEKLSGRYVDEVAGYSIRFPTGWTVRRFRGARPWVLDASSGHAMISIGFTTFPAEGSVDQLIPEKIARDLRAKPGTTVHADGYAPIDGRRSLWHKYTGPLPTPGGTPRMTMVHYLLPLQDGRALEVRAAASPEQFDGLARRMKQSLQTFRLLPPATARK